VCHGGYHQTALTAESHRTRACACAAHGSGTAGEEEANSESTAKVPGAVKLKANCKAQQKDITEPGPKGTADQPC